MILHFITSRWRNELISFEYNPARPFAEIVDDVWSGQVEDVERVFRFDTDTGFGTDITKEVARELYERSHRDFVEPYYGLVPLIEGFGFEPYKETPPARRARLSACYAEH